jgi:hypothetical protein
MKNLLLIVIALMLGGCGFLSKPMTRLMPKIEKIDLPEELMKKPQDLLIIVKPDPPKEVGDAGVSGKPAGENVVTPKG